MELVTTWFQADPLTRDLGRPLHRVGTWPSPANAGGLLVADFLTHRNGGPRLAKLALQRAVKFGVVFFRQEDEPFVIVEMLGRASDVAEIVEAATCGKFELLDTYERDQAPRETRALHVPESQSGLAADGVGLDP